MGSFGTTDAGLRVDETHPEVVRLVGLGLSPDAAIGTVVGGYNRGRYQVQAASVDSGTSGDAGTSSGADVPPPASTQSSGSVSAASTISEDPTPEDQILQKLLSEDVTTSGDFGELIAQEQRATDQAKAATSASYARARAGREELGKKQLGSGKVLVAREGGTPLPAGSVEMTFLNSIENETKSAIEDLTAQEQQAIAGLDMEGSRRITQLKLQQQDRLDQVQARKQALTLQVLGEMRAQEQFRIQKEEYQRTKAKETLTTFAALNVDPQDLPQNILMDLEKTTGLPAGAGVMWYDAQRYAAALTEQKGQLEMNKMVLEANKAAFELSQYIEPGKQVEIPLPDGTTMVVTGKRKDGKWEKTEVHRPDGNWLVFTDEQGIVRNEVRLGDNYVAPYYDSDTQEWKVYNPVTHTEDVVFKEGQYGEGLAGMQALKPYLASLTQTYGQPSQGPGGAISHQHLTGWDYSVPAGTRVVSPNVNGIVTKMGTSDKNLKSATGSDADYGNFVDVMDVNSGAQFRLAHLSRLDVKPGDQVPPGGIVGLSGNTGFSTGPHLHVELRTADGKAVLPNKGAPGSAQPVNANIGGLEDLFQLYAEDHAGVELNPQSRKDRDMVLAWSDTKRKEEAETVKRREDLAIAANKDFKTEPDVKNFNEVKAHWRNIQAAWQQLQKNVGTGTNRIVQDQSIILLFNKLLQPQSFVRESQYMVLSGGQSILDSIKSSVEKAVVGGSGVNVDILGEAVAQAESFYRGYEKQYKGMINSRLVQARIQHLDPRLLIDDYEMLPDVRAVGTDGRTHDITPMDDDYTVAFFTGMVGNDSIARRY